MGVKNTNDMLLLVGLALVSWGLWMIYVPAMLVFAGLVLCVIAVLGEANGARSKPDQTPR